MAKKIKILVRGAGDLATGVICCLHNAGFQVLALEAAHPSAIRRQVALSEAVYAGSAVVENVTAVCVENLQAAAAIWQKGAVPLLVDEKAACLAAFCPSVLVDAIIAKRNLGTTIGMAPLTIALGPGFTAGVDVHAVIETQRGHNLGRIIYSGSAAADSGVPGNIAGYTQERVLHAAATGIFHGLRPIGSVVTKGEVIAEIITDKASIPVRASINGIIRGLIRDNYFVTSGFKIADIDPRREELANCFTVSDKARCLAGSVLEVICAFVNNKENSNE